MPVTTRPYGCRGDRHATAGPLAPDLTRATTFAYASADQLRAVGAGEADGEFYPRYGHPAARAFESAVAELEAADGAVSFASGMATIHALFCAPLGAGAVVVARDVYGGTSALVEEDLPRFGIEVRRFDPFLAGDLERVLDDGVRLVHVETPTNPVCRVVDVARTAAAAHACGALLSVDATFAPPPLQRVADHGADLVVHSATKFLGGHSDALGGVVAGAHAHLEPLEGFRRRTGGVLAPDTAWLLARSLKTLPLRVRAATDSAARLARFLEGRGLRVSYPGLPGHPDHELAQRQMTRPGSLLAFEVQGGLAGAARVYDRLEVIARAVSLGGTETTALLPVHTSHAMVPADDRRRAGIGDGLIRLSVGLEPCDVLERDLAQALAG